MNIIGIVAILILILGIAWILSNIENEIRKLRINTDILIIAMQMKEKQNDSN